ncbi:hypothetical protein PENANT_c001G02606 [Penicillium antarcticum]|uniref:Uncharacterized protein n=1 Tax=Penicillium antarcticum TaxID=416450 RepID=A0A1V6QPI0_9EURO|nr:hypothetical protein PENANT_c001G02606 [Penicillium antarcticum]
MGVRANLYVGDNQNSSVPEHTLWEILVNAKVNLIRSKGLSIAGVFSWPGYLGFIAAYVYMMQILGHIPEKLMMSVPLAICAGPVQICPSTRILWGDCVSNTSAAYVYHGQYGFSSDDLSSIGKVGV